MNRLFLISKIAFGIFGTFILIQLLIGIPSILIFKINFINKEFSAGLVILNIVTELILISYYVNKFGLLNKFLNQFKNIHLNKLLVGFALSFLLPLFFYYLLFKFNNGSFTNGGTTFKEQIGVMLSIFILAMCEELLCRFIMLEKFSKLSSKFSSILISTFFFTILHLANPGITVFAILNLVLFGMLLSLIYFKTRDLLLVTVIHFVWNYTTGCIIGSNLSGIKLPSIFKYTSGKSFFLDGDKFGIEGSPITFIGLATIIIIYIIYTNKLKDKLETNVV